MVRRLMGGRAGHSALVPSPLVMEFLQRRVSVVDVAIFLKKTDTEFRRLAASQLNVSKLAQISMDQRDVRYALRREDGRRFQGVVPRNDQVDQKSESYSDLSCGAILEVSPMCSND